MTKFFNIFYNTGGVGGKGISGIIGSFEINLILLAGTGISVLLAADSVQRTFLMLVSAQTTGSTSSFLICL